MRLHIARTARTLLLACVASAALLAAAPTARAAGLLVPRDGSPAVEVESQRVSVDVDDGLARTTVRQTFVNPGDRSFEAVYVFPVPVGATLVDCAMEVGGERLEGLVVERQRARRVYDSIVNRNRDPALVEQIGRSKFRLSVFPVLPKQPTVVELTWIEHVPLESGRYRYVYPLSLAGRATETQRDLTVSITLRTSAALTAATSPTPGMDVVRRGPHEVRASLERIGEPLDQDVVLEVAAAAEQADLRVRTFRDKRGRTYFAAVVTPPTPLAAQRIPRDVTVLVDSSGSMAGTKLAQALDAARRVVASARPDDRVNVVSFSSDLDSFAPSPVAMTDENRARLNAWIDSVVSGGGTALGDAIAHVARQPSRKGRATSILVLTDGAPTIGLTDDAQILASIQGEGPATARIHTFGIGHDVRPALLEGLARVSGGTAEMLRPNADTAAHVERLVRRTAFPVMTGLELSVDGGAVRDVLPRGPVDLYLGEQTVLTGRINGTGASTVVVRGSVAGRDVVLSQRVELPTEPAGRVAVRDLWAKRKIAFLESAHRLRRGLADDAYYEALDRGAYSTTDEIVAEIIDTSIDCSVQSAYASFLVLLPEDVANLDPRDRDALVKAAERASDRKRVLAGLPDERTAGTGGSGPPEVEEAKPIEEMEKAIEDPVVEESKVSDHNEIDDAWAGNESIGDPRFNSDAPFEGPGTNGTIGIGGGAGGAFGGRRGGRRNLRAGGGGKRSQNAVDKALEWLKNHQSPGGQWDSDGFDERCRLNKCSGPGHAAYDPGQTGLSLLCFLGAGETHNSGAYKDVVKNGLRYLKSVQSAEGCFGPQVGNQWQYNHVTAALAMTEAYGLTGSRLFEDSAQRGVDFVQKAQNPYLAWRYGIRDGDNDTSVTGWAVMTLKSAKLADLDVDDTSFRGAVAWIEKMTDPATGRVGYQQRGGPPARAQDMVSRFPAVRSESLTGLGMLVRIFAGEHPAKSDAIRKGADLVVAKPPVWNTNDGSVDFYYWYFGSLAMHQVGGDHWKRWKQAMETAILANQRDQQGTDERGSWDPVDPWGQQGGRVYSTAMNCLCLEVYYRYGRVFGTR